jgi:hypothetical protein
MPYATEGAPYPSKSSSDITAIREPRRQASAREPGMGRDASVAASGRTSTGRKRRREPLRHQDRMSNRLGINAEVDEGVVQGVLLPRRPDQRASWSAHHLARSRRDVAEL